MESHRSFTTICLRKTLIAPSVYELRFEKPAGFLFKPGQFVLFDVPLPEDANDVQPRAYSIASAPSEPDLLFVIKLVPNGRASRWIEKTLNRGTSIRIQGPFGAFTLDTETPEPYFFLATGTGIAPLRSQILWALKEYGDTRSMHLLFGVLKREDLFWEDEWKRLEQEHPNFHAHVSFLSGDRDWHGEGGSLQERLPRIVQVVPSSRVYICGAPVTVTELKEECLILGIPKVDIHSESYV
ncbi:MAG: FAD-dependent oxidoreductase [Candidatus Peregrinibacteria bacterium]|nr:FAD-dependent oxidoreductase [Candidatus Peregrinibacteria bacterium]